MLLQRSAGEQRLRRLMKGPGQAPGVFFFSFIIRPENSFFHAPALVHQRSCASRKNWLLRRPIRFKELSAHRFEGGRRKLDGSHAKF